ncbi:MAG: asparagine synthetase [Homavirus sp.]|uniref:asparagine synthase (glutamine-hydrolyzing) n=1 Tax=Homavirus sp. TaxID=2487769 RepID=A0A3G5A5R1_9VIRU|nr:MAG: asparagine synthetase [Homavirus sp.]
MCGIWGYLSRSTKDLSSADKDKLYHAFNTIKHRGPDKSTFLDIKKQLSLFLGFHRLAIMDTSTNGDQPFIIETSTRTTYCLANGEIYNFKQLTKEFGLQHKLKSQSDCEVIPHIFHSLGPKSLFRSLIGEFAIALIDIDHTSSEITIRLGRDRFGQRPLFYGQDEKGFAFSSEMKGLIGIVDPKSIKQLEPGMWIRIAYKPVFDQLFSQVYSEYTTRSYYKRTYPISKDYPSSYDLGDITDICKNIRTCFERSVIDMLESDRDIGALLSGGLDSSLVVSIASKYMRNTYGRKLKTFSIGLPGSTDKQYAQIVADYCGTEHTHVEFTNQQFLEALRDVIYATETFDITTIRASTGQYLISQWIVKNTNVKVLLIGDGSDELTGGYMYFHKAPTPEESHKENIKLLTQIHFYDVLRADRGISHGLEARVPFLDHRFVDMYMKLDPRLRVPIDGVEKWLLRKAFDTDTYLPRVVLWRKKEAFSDGVSSLDDSWYKTIQQYADTMYTDEELAFAQQQYTHCPPPTKEALYFREIFEEFYFNAGHVIPHYWLPNWCGNIQEPSARALDVYE